MKSAFTVFCCLVSFSALIINLVAPVNCSASEPLVIGVLHSEAYTYAKMMKNSFDMALEVINKAGGIKGRPLKLVYANDQGQPKSGERATIELVEKNGGEIEGESVRIKKETVTVAPLEQNFEGYAISERRSVDQRITATDAQEMEIEFEGIGVVLTGRAKNLDFEDKINCCWRNS